MVKGGAARSDRLPMSAFGPPPLACYKPMSRERVGRMMGFRVVTGWGRPLAWGLFAVALAGCSSNPSPGPSVSGGSSSSSFRERMTNLFFGPSGDGADAQALAAANKADPNMDCPVADIRSGASTLQENASKDVQTLRYQATISRLARECTVKGSTMTVRVGVQGRVVLGPAGTPGEVEIPLRYALIQEGPEPKTILTRFYRFPVNVAEGQSNVPFLHIEEDITFPVPPSIQLENYVVYVGFDPASAKPAPAAKTPRKSR